LSESVRKDGGKWKDIIIEAPDIPAEEEAAARLAERLRNVHCPPNYWAKQADTDRRLRDEQSSLSDRELVEVKARLIVFDASPDGAAWRKMMYLSRKTRTPADQAELDELNRHYPGMPLTHYAAWYKNHYFEEQARKWDGGARSNWYKSEEALWTQVQRYR
jgi:hypothetical protein